MIEDKSLRHVAMVANFLYDNKLETSLKKRIRTVSNFIDLIQFHLICQMLATFSGGESERTSSKFRARAHEIRKFHVAVVQSRLRNVQKSVMHVQSCCLTNKPVALFAVLFTVAVVVAQAPYCCDPEILLPW